MSLELRRRSIRLRHYDYSQAGLYFVTICTHERKPLFGKVVDGMMMLNPSGAMMQIWWQKLPGKFATCRMHEFVIMPNHMHGIIEIVNDSVGADPCVCPLSAGRTHRCAPTNSVANSVPLSQTVQWFKTMTTNAYLRGIKQDDWQPFMGRLWQRNYHEHIIRTHESYLTIAEYIQTNPLRWLEDTYWAA